MEMSTHAMMAGGESSHGGGGWADTNQSAATQRSTAGGYRPPTASVGFMDAVNSFGASVSSAVGNAWGAATGSAAGVGHAAAARPATSREFSAYIPVQQQSGLSQPGQASRGASQQQQSQQFTLEDDDDIQVAL